MYNRTRRLFMALLCCVITVAAFGQGVNITSGSINGQITDSSGGVLPGVTVTATNADTGQTRTTVTDNTGHYSLNLLPPGIYRVDAELSGLGKSSSPKVTVLLGNDTKTDLKLAPQVAESITVSSVAPVIDTQRTGMAESVTNKQIESLPLLGRDFRALASLTPGVSTGSFDTASITADGARPLSTDYNIDGASSDNDFFGQQTGGSRAPFTFSQAAIKEFQVIRTQYDAEYGRGVGAVVNAITKSGGNQLEGELFYFDRSKSWASSRSSTINTNINGTTFPLVASDSFLAKNVTEPGFDLGGPIMRDKLFFFVNADGQRNSQPALIGNDMRTSAQFLALTPAQQTTVLSKIQTAVGLPYESGLSYTQANKLNTYLVKFDGNLGEKNHWSLRDNVTKFDTTDSGSTTTFGLNQTNEVDKFYQLALEGDTVFTSNIFNQFIGQVGRDQRPVTASNTGTEFSINYSTNTQFFGAADTTPNTADEKKYQFKDTLNYQWRGQSLKAGVELLHRSLFDAFPRYANGMYTFGGTNGLLNFVNNTPTAFMQAYGPENGNVAWNTNLWGTYINDSFHLGSRLTVDAGLRYDYEATPRPPSNAFPQHPEFLTQIKNDSNNIGPRMGFAYDVFGNGRSVLRGGAGKFFEYMPDILLASPIQGISGALITTTFTCNPASNCPTYPNIFSPTDFLAKSKLGSNLVTIGSDYQAQEATRGSLQFEQQLGTTYSAGISGIYSKLTHVQGTANINIVPSGILLGNMPVYDYYSSTNPLRPYNDLGIIREVTSNEQAWYRAETIEFHKLATNDSKWSWDLSYTYSNSIDDETNTRSTSTTFLIDPRNPSLSEGISDNDLKHRVVGDLIYRLPFGIQLSAVAFWHSGFPYTAAINFSGCTPSCPANSLTGQAQTSVAANFTPVFVNSNGDIIDITQANGFTRAQFASFLASQGGHLISRNTFRMPGVYDGDIRLSKRFNLVHGTSIELIGEMYNILNKNMLAVSGVNQDLFKISYTQATDKYTITHFTNNVAPAGQPANNQNTFGVLQQYSSEVSPRQLQFAAKITF
ncbi:MAG TPA: carboxypeptidase regulatory-like domain-containing protein [Thermoanaerobaculia bacterium]|jgi:hypothetical protein|nr:carboxypeptidase regulatory-like domain-containing protein [Thermoanaerobaculia bacterium]